MTNTWHIPIDSHLVTFARKAFFDGESEPLEIDERSLIGKLVFLFLIDARLPDHKISESETTLQVKLSTTLQKRSPNLLKLSRLNQCLDDLFKMQLRSWVAGQVCIGSTRNRAVISFLEYYGIHSVALEERYYQYVTRAQNKSYKDHVADLETETNHFE